MLKSESSSYGPCHNSVPASTVEVKPRKLENHVLYLTENQKTSLRNSIVKKLSNGIYYVQYKSRNHITGRLGRTLEFTLSVGSE